ncbi:MAG: hypothetical protein BGO49_17660 [Planctomycetales bacterium 71-10]|nr:MAG: hypothetical protein BGO49_17660 [Planctomycetales bacterium 71-10]
MSSPAAAADDNASFSDAASDYLERHRVYETFHLLLKSLTIHRPKDPVAFMISQLDEPEERLRVVLLAPPDARLSSRATLLSALVDKFGLVRVSLPALLEDEVLRQSALGTKAKSYLDRGAAVPDELSVAVITAALARSDCVSKGWVLDGFPNTPTQARYV